MRFSLLRSGFLLAALLGLLASGAKVQAEVQRGGLTVSYADARDRAHLGAVFKAWETAARDLRALGLPPPAQVRIVAAASAADFAARTGEPASIAASTRGGVIVTQRLAALALSGRLPTTIRHEAFHTAQPAGLPRWLAEGLARLFQRRGGQRPAGSDGTGRPEQRRTRGPIDRSRPGPPRSRVPGSHPAGRATRQSAGLARCGDQPNTLSAGKFGLCWGMPLPPW